MSMALVTNMIFPNIYKNFMKVLITNGYIVYYFNVVAFKTEIYDDDIRISMKFTTLWL